VGMVVRAYDEELQRDVALKFLHAKSDDHEASQALLREAQMPGDPVRQGLLIARADLVFAAISPGSAGVLPLDNAFAAP
jgi:hypothetical protein